MKNLRKVFTMILALAMVLSLAVTGFATEPPKTYTLKVNNTANNHTYEAYQIFSGDLTEKDGRQILSNIEWGTGVNGPALLAAIDAKTELSALHGQPTAAKLAEKISTLTDDSATLDLFAEVVGQHLVAASGTCTDMGDYYEIAGLPSGYYLVKDMDESLNGNEGEAYTKYIIRVLKDAEVSPKSSVPTVDKSINDTLGGTYTDIEDFDINDTVYYKWVGTLPSNLHSYEKYYYEFIDTLPEGIAYIDIQQVYIEGHDGNVVHVFYDVTDTDSTNDTMPDGMTSSETATGITLRIDDLLTLYPNVLPTQKVVVKYTARVTRDALIADSMTNEVKVKYSNNPNGSGDGDFGYTPPDVAHAFTFQINVDKYDADNVNTKLEGAEFVLYYERTEADAIVKHYATVITEEMIDEGKVINGTAVDADDLGVVYGWTTDRTQASVLDTDANGALSVKGMDEGIYYLEETKAPAGYNLMETPVMIEIIPAYTIEGVEASVTVSYKVDTIAQTSNTVGVRNSSGSTLPSTGGIGTTIFYILGGLMVLGASVILVTKKRMGAAE